MKYIKVRWIHTSTDYPTILYSELNDDRFELRKVEVYTDGRMEFADHDEWSGSTQLSINPLPPLEEMAADPEFEPMVISAEEFETTWESAKEL